MSVRDELRAEIESMTDDEARDFYDLLEFGFDRLMSGESAESIYRDWDRQRKGRLA